ncbi:preprotein translocase subunit SecG [Buchnera aphidicola]|uniref:preprotein translocase subunit SecG n=1 Tax=Buchnera aphidicola TaxID=9 RepID=UPI00094C0F3B
MYNCCLGIFIFVSIFLIFFIMIQNGKNSDVNTVFGLEKSKQIITNYSNNTLTKIISILAFLFFLISLIICNVNYNNIF